MHAIASGARQRATIRLRAIVMVLALAAGALLASVGTSTPAAHGATPTTAQIQAQAAARQERVHRVMTWAAGQKGKPYHYGSAGPYRFDCSGLVLYVFKRALDESLPRTAAAQYRASQHIAHRWLKVGDLVFVVRGGAITHVGIYAGDGYWWVAPHTGTRVQKQKIYPATHVYGRFIH